MWFRACVLLTLGGLHFTAALPPSPAAVAIQASLNAAIGSRDAAFALPPGNIYFNSANLSISGATFLNISGGASPPTTLYFEPGFGVLISNSSDVALERVVIDYFPLPYVFGPITQTARGSFTVALDPASLTFEELLARFPPHDTFPPPSIFDPATSDLLGIVCGWGKPAPATPISPRVYSVACASPRAVRGAIFVAATRVGITLALSLTARVAIRDVDIHAAGYMAITEFLGGGGNLYERVRLIPRNASRPLASNADGFHSSGLTVGPTLRAVQLRNLLDDYFNVHNTLQLAVGGGGADPAAVLLGDYQLFGGGENTVYGTQQTLSRAAPGDELSFFPLNTFTYPPLARATIASIARVAPGPATDALLAAAYANASAAAAKTPCSACNAGLNKYAEAQLYRLVLSSPLPAGARAGALVSSAAGAARGAVVEDCFFSGSASNLGRWKSQDSVIQRNVWRNTVRQNLEVMPLQNWLEGPMGVHNVSIRDNVFHGTAESPVHVFGCVDVREVNNTFSPEA